MVHRRRWEKSRFCHIGVHCTVRSCCAELVVSMSRARSHTKYTYGEEWMVMSDVCVRKKRLLFLNKVVNFKNMWTRGKATAAMTTNKYAARCATAKAKYTTYEPHMHDILNPCARTAKTYYTWIGGRYWMKCIRLVERVLCTRSHVTDNIQQFFAFTSIRYWTNVNS